jgi:hypothetical protein
MSITKSNSVLETVSCLQENAVMSSIHFCKKISHLLITERKSSDFLSAVCYNETFLLLLLYCENAVE